MPQLNSSPFHIRSMIHSDLREVLIWRNHPDIRNYMYTRHEISLEEHQRWFERSLLNPKMHLLMFEVNQKALGFVNFTEIGCGRRADWGFYAAPHAPKGTGRQLGITALNYAFTQLQLHKICGQALAYNERSIRFHQTMGFHQEGILREEHFDGKNHHHIICFGLLAREWKSDF